MEDRNKNQTILENLTRRGAQPSPTVPKTPPTPPKSKPQPTPKKKAGIPKPNRTPNRVKPSQKPQEKISRSSKPQIKKQPKVTKADNNVSYKPILISAVTTALLTTAGLSIVFIFFNPNAAGDISTSEAIDNIALGQSGEADFTSTTTSADTVVEVNDEDLGVINQRDGVYTYSYDLDGNPIKITQQPVPADFTEGSSSLVQVVQSIPDTASIESLQTNNGIAYIANSLNGSQSVIFVSGNLLLFVTSDLPLENSLWLDFINLI